MGIFACFFCSDQKKWEKPQSSSFFCGLDTVSCAECLEAAACCPHWHFGCLFAPLSLLLPCIPGGNAEGHVGGDGRTGKWRDKKPQRLGAELARGTELQQERSQALGSAVGQRSKFNTYFPSSALHTAPNLIPVRDTEAAAKELF